jgi:hypothetical protein
VVPTEPDAPDLIATALTPAPNSKIAAGELVERGLVLKEDDLTQANSCVVIKP